MAPVDSLPDELLEKIVGLLVPPFSTSAPPPQKRNMFSLDKTKNNRRSAKPVLDAPKSVGMATSTVSSSRSSTDYGDLNSLARVNKRLNLIVTPILYQNVTLRVTEVTHAHEQLLKAVRGQTGDFIRAVSIRDPDPVAHPRIITPNYRNNLIFAFSNFLVHFFEALSEHSSLVSFHWNVFDTLVMPPMFMDFLPPDIQEFTLDQGRVIPVAIYPNLRKFVYRAHMLSCTSNCVYERRISRLLYLNFENMRYLQLQNVNLAVCFEFRSAYYQPSSFESSQPHKVVASTSAPDDEENNRLASTAGHSSMISAPARSVLLANSHLSSDNHVHSTSGSSPTSPISHASPTSPAASSSSLLSPTSSAPSSPSNSSTAVHPPTTSPTPTQPPESAQATSTPSVFFLSPPVPSSHKAIVFPNLETAYFTDFFTASSVSSFTCEWLIDLLNDHRNNLDLTIKYASRCVGKDAIFVREWGLLVPDPDVVGVNGQRLSDEESFRRAGWASGVKTGTWKGWNWEYSTIKGWTMTTTIGQDYNISR
ncbi:hypothetical protein POJ06DRAFT_235006 [Lipomyces tetrasporus]|uniref:Uncharacterized protein n=1 Tax=Lipomyces tetrasporus TaxID=54092 RepID=A0AAD7R026_9ASCO|nr:uncharacterized protein POJ06DRAFT_235006 [Lipomyces tetrasporus]KAJ8104031.1 hypothetical protein POJ06DRAFT_235006 [Lipomyces tetrasporus]